jgi:hypothetical protein
MELNPALLPLETLAWTAISAWALVEWCRPLLKMFNIDIIGLGAGAMNSIIVGIIKSKVKKAAGEESDDAKS